MSITEAEVPNLSALPTAEIAAVYAQERASIGELATRMNGSYAALAKDPGYRLKYSERFVTA